MHFINLLGSKLACVALTPIEKLGENQSTQFGQLTQEETGVMNVRRDRLNLRPLLALFCHDVEYSLDTDVCNFNPAVSSYINKMTERIN